MTAGLATIRALLEPGVFEAIEKTTINLIEGIQVAAASAKVPIQAGHVGTMFGFYFLKESDVAITNYADAKRYADTERYAQFFHAMLEAGVYLAPSQFEAGFLSCAHTEDSTQQTLASIGEVFANMASHAGS
jgi:glutamate-1-semialdehyde 2,1-aminomutase